MSSPQRRPGMAAIGGSAGCDRRRSAGQLGSIRGCAVRPSLRPDLVRNRAYLLDHLLRLKPADWLAVKITDPVGDASAEHRPGPFDQLAGDRHAGLGVAVTVFGHQLMVEPGQLRILPPGRVRAWKNANRSTAGPSFGDRPAGLRHRARRPGRRVQSDVAGCWRELVGSRTVRDAAAGSGVARRAAPNRARSCPTVRRLRLGLLSAPGIHLLSDHVGKGQQFDCVAVVGAEDGVIPDFRAKTTAAALEEARILSVMISRARHSVVVTCSARVPTPAAGYGTGSRRRTSPGSRLPDSQATMESRTSSKVPSGRQSRRDDQRMCQMRVGLRSFD